MSSHEAPSKELFSVNRDAELAIEASTEFNFTELAAVVSRFGCAMPSSGALQSLRSLLPNQLTAAQHTFTFAPVINLPVQYEVFDFTAGYDPERTRAAVYGIGRYDEKRKNMYTSELFVADERSSVRDVHFGIDIAAPVGEPVRAFYEGRIFLAAINPAKGDYGGTIITEHELAAESGAPTVLWALHGHLSHASVASAVIGNSLAAGETIGFVGESFENGGWNPHLHFQLSRFKPLKCDLPGAVADCDRRWARFVFPDPRHVLGPLYP